jgi:hypothetical protein
MLLEKNVVGNQEDWAQYITQADSHETPLLNSIRVGDKPVNVLYQYQADKYDEPTDDPWIDGKDWNTFKSAAANRAELKSRVQWFVETASVSKLAQDVTNAAGVADELAREIPKKLTEMSRRIEAAAGSDQAAYEDDGANGNKFQGIGRWIQADATSQLYATPAAYRPGSAQISAVAQASFFENTFRDLLDAQWNVTGYSGGIDGYVGSSLKNRFRDFQFYVPTALTQSTARVTNRQATDTALGEMIDTYRSDYGTVTLRLDKWLHHANFGGSAALSKWRGYFLNPSMWEWRWNQRPTVYKPDFEGGSYKAAMDAIIMLVCRNPVGEVKTAITLT